MAIKNCLLAGILSFVLPCKAFSEESLLTNILRAANSIEVGDLELYDELEKYGLTYSEFQDYINDKFLSYGLDPDNKGSEDQDPAQLDITILTEGNAIFIETELKDDAFFLPIRVFTYGTIWKKIDIINAKTSRSVKDDVLLTIGEAIDEILRLYLASK